MSTGTDWTTGPAKWAAVVVLGSAAIFGMTWSILTRGPNPSTVPYPELDAPAAEPDEPAAASPAAPAPEEPTALGGVRIDINSAGVDALELLPGIGPVLAARIVEDRRTNGPFARIEELDRVPGIGVRTIERLRPFVTAE